VVFRGGSVGAGTGVVANSNPDLVLISNPDLDL
jgi:hypothetical protein